MGNLFQGVIKVLSGDIATEGIASAERVGMETLATLKDTERGVVMFGDNLRGDALYTFRDTKNQGFVFMDSLFDNIAIVVDKQMTNVFDTVQFGMIMVGATSVVFMVMYGDKLFQHGIRLGRINLL